VFRIILQPLYLPVKRATHYAGQWGSAAGVYTLANQGYHPEAKLSYSDQEHSVGNNAVSFWKMEVKVAGSSTIFILCYQTQQQHVPEHHHNLGA